MCTIKYVAKKAVSGVIGTSTGMIVGRLNKIAGVATGAVATVATDLGLDWLESKIKLAEAIRKTEAGTDDFEFFNDEFDDNEFEVEDDYSDVAEETVTVESVMTAETATEQTSGVTTEQPSNVETEETKKLSPLEEDKQKPKELKLDELDGGEEEETPKGAPATNRRLNPTTRK